MVPPPSQSHVAQQCPNSSCSQLSCWELTSQAARTPVLDFPAAANLDLARSWRQIVSCSSSPLTVLHGKPATSLPTGRRVPARRITPVADICASSCACTYCHKGSRAGGTGLTKSELVAAEALPHFRSNVVGNCLIEANIERPRELALSISTPVHPTTAPHSITDCTARTSFQHRQGLPVNLQLLRDQQVR